MWFHHLSLRFPTHQVRKAQETLPALISGIVTSEKGGEENRGRMEWEREEEERGRRERKETDRAGGVKAERSKIEDETEARGGRNEKGKGEHSYLGAGVVGGGGRRKHGQNSRRHVRGTWCSSPVWTYGAHPPWISQSGEPGGGTTGARIGHVGASGQSLQWSCKQEEMADRILGTGSR